MRRHFLRNVAALALLGAALGCQEYSFNPVGRCLLQPGAERVEMSNVSSADVLFVVDDSGSMFGEQAKLADAFDAFITSLNGYNDRRVTNHLAPFDFHIAITTTSVFQSRPWYPEATCRATCGTASNVCCQGTTTPVQVAKTCPTGAGCSGSNTCKKTCDGHDGEDVCCDASGNVEMTTISCTTPGVECGEIQNRYAFPKAPVRCGSGYPACGSGFSCGGCGNYGYTVCCSQQSNPQPQLVVSCTPGIAQDGTLYPRGGFVGLGTNPRVLHFDKSLYATWNATTSTWDPVSNPTTAVNAQNFTRAQLKDFFKANVNVGTCGSGQEQGLEAARLAITKALAGKQVDRRNAAGQVVDSTAAWPHEGAKLVVVYVGDEDDCSSPEDPIKGVILKNVTGYRDSCVYDASLPLDQQKQTKVDGIVRDLEALGRPVSAAFVVSTSKSTCVDDACTPGICCDVCAPSLLCGNTSTCGGQGAGTRFLQAAGALRRDGADVVAASICDPGAVPCNVQADCAGLTGTTCADGTTGAPGKYCRNPNGTLAGKGGFASILSRIAEIVKPPSALLLPTQPADSAVTLLRITGSDGKTRKFCNGPASPPAGGYDPSNVTSANLQRTAAYQQALGDGFDWWFTESREQFSAVDKAPWSASRFVYINQETNQCVPNPGEYYSADYLGLVPASGCRSDADCSDVLGEDYDWTCFAGTNEAGACVAPAPGKVGTCVCGTRAATCANGGWNGMP